MKKHLISATILIALLLLMWAMAAIDAVFIGVLTIAVLGFMYGCIHLTVITWIAMHNEQQ
tara:strand:- start:172 stop:351 length:180 start_codon:yes stop_codon:yes gene_type:complete